jgi:hypothetical protein
MHRPPTFAAADQPRFADGISPYAGSNLPGPISGADDAASAARGNAAVTAHIAPSMPFTVGLHAYRLYQTVTGWNLTSHDVPIRPAVASEILAEAIATYAHDAALIPLLEQAANNLAGLHPGGTYILAMLQVGMAPAAPPASSLAATPSGLVVPASPPDLPTLEELPLAEMQAAVLKEAAISGVPFCEECARAAAQQAAAAF